MWTELHQCQQLATALTGQRLPELPGELLLLLPPPPRQGWPAGMPEAPYAAQWLQRWGYPQVRRAQRLSYVVGVALPTLLAVPTANELSMPLPPGFIPLASTVRHYIGLLPV